MSKVRPSLGCFPTGLEGCGYLQMHFAEMGQIDETGRFITPPADCDLDRSRDVVEPGIPHSSLSNKDEEGSPFCVFHLALRGCTCH